MGKKKKKQQLCNHYPALERLISQDDFNRASGQFCFVLFCFYSQTTDLFSPSFPSWVFCYYNLI